MKQEKEILKELIEDSDCVDFAPFGEGTSEDWISKKEGKLGIRFPASYRWWMQQYSGGEVNGLEIYSVYEEDDVVGGDILSMARVNEKNFGFSPQEKLYIMESGHHSAYFDTAAGSLDEFTVIEDWDGEIITHKSFISFLINLIERFS